MSKSGEKEPLENLKEQFSSFFGLKSPQEKNEELPPKAHFSIWYERPRQPMFLPL